MDRIQCRLCPTVVSDSKVGYSLKVMIVDRGLSSHNGNQVETLQSCELRHAPSTKMWFLLMVCYRRVLSDTSNDEIVLGWQEKITKLRIEECISTDPQRRSYFKTERRKLTGVQDRHKPDGTCLAGWKVLDTQNGIEFPGTTYCHFWTLHRWRQHSPKVRQLEIDWQSLMHAKIWGGVLLWSGFYSIPSLSGVSRDKRG